MYAVSMLGFRYADWWQYLSRQYIKNFYLTDKLNNTIQYKLNDLTVFAMLAESLTVSISYDNHKAVSKHVRTGVPTMISIELKCRNNLNYYICQTSSLETFTISKLISKVNVHSVNILNIARCYNVSTFRGLNILEYFPQISIYNLI